MKTYITTIPRTLADGVRLVHNQVTPQRQLERNGFRAWVQLGDGPPLTPCNCNWAGVDLHGLPHYRTMDIKMQPSYYCSRCDFDDNYQIGGCVLTSDEVKLAEEAWINASQGYMECASSLLLKSTNPDLVWVGKVIAHELGSEDFRHHTYQMICEYLIAHTTGVFKSHCDCPGCRTDFLGE